MRRGSGITAVTCLTALFAGVPAFAQGTPPGAPSSPNAPPAAAASPGGDQTFLLGLRRIGVVAGHAVACAPDKDKQAAIAKATDLGGELAMQFGFNAAS